MKAPLFRAESLEYQQRKLWGDVAIVQPLSFKILTTFIVVVTIVGLAYVSVGNYHRTENVLGYVAPVGGIAHIYADRGGTVSAVLVDEGDHVRKGQLLLEMTTAAAGTAGKLGTNLQERTRLRLKEITTQLEVSEKRYYIEGKRLQSNIAGMKLDAESIRSRLLVEKQLYAEIESDTTRWTELVERGMVSRTDASKLQQQVLNQLGRVRELEQILISKENELLNAQKTLEMVPYEREEKLAALRAERSTVEQSLAQLELPDAYVLEAPFDGYVVALQAGHGHIPSVNTPLVSLVPNEATTVVYLLVPSRAAGAIEIGQKVMIRVDAFPFQRFGHIDGIITQISKSVYKPDELLAPISVQEAVYRVIVTPNTFSVSAYGEERSLNPGMTLTADIIVNRGSFLDFILDPLRAKFRNARQT